MSAPKAAAYKPLDGSLAQRVIAYFRRFPEPDEALSLSDLALKYSETPANVATFLITPVELGILLKDGKMFSAGPNIGQLEPAPKLHGPAARNPAVRAPAAPAAPRRPYPKPRLDFSTLQVDEDVPLIPKSRTGRGKWDGLFAKLTKPGQSIAIDAAFKSALMAEAAKRRKLKQGDWRVAFDDDQNTRIWRIE